jgi:ribosomal protein L11 methyltransferase
MSAPTVMTEASSTGCATSSAELVRLTLVVPASQADVVIARACVRLGFGCREELYTDGRIALHFWATPTDISRVRAVLADLAVDVGDAVVDEADEDPGWVTAMRAFHQPVDVMGRVRIRPPWHPALDDMLDIVIDPAMAFGTGQHDTTRGCLELLLGCTPGALLDIGCGSGVLAIAASKLGFSPVWAGDIDPLAIDATQENATINRVEIEVALCDVLVTPLPRVDVILANLTATVLTSLAAVLGASVPAVAILSGMRLDELRPVCEAWAELGMVPADRRLGTQWCSVKLVRQ